MSRVVVVGGGLAGITAALECAEVGAAVTLLEARPRLGGATFSVEKEGLWLDNGQHVFLRCCTEYIGLIERLGVADDVVLQPRLQIPVLSPGGKTAWLRRNGLPPPLHLAGSLLRFGHLSARDRVRLGPAVLALRRLRLDNPGLDEQTFGTWLDGHGQSAAAVDALWDLITLPTVNLRARDASLALATKVFQTGLLDRADASDVGYARVPLQRLHGDAAERALAAAGVALHAKARVSALLPADAGIAVSWGAGTLDADAVILAVPHEEAVELLPGGALPAGLDPGAPGLVPDRQPARRLRPQGQRAAVRGRRRDAGAMGLRPDELLRADGRPMPRRVAFRGRCVHLPLGRRASGRVPARARRSLPGGPGRRGVVVLRHPGAACDVQGRARAPQRTGRDP